MNEFDIYLNKRITECDLIVRSLPYRDGLTVINTIVLESCALEYLLLKYIALQSHSVLTAHIDEMLKICREMLDAKIDIEASSAFHALYLLHPTPVDIVVSADFLQSTLHSYVHAGSVAEIDIDPIYLYAAKHFGHGESDLLLEIDQRLIKRCIEAFQHIQSPDAQISKMLKYIFSDAPSSLDMGASVKNLCYVSETAGVSAIEVKPEVISIEIHFPLGIGVSDMLIGVVSDGERATKFEEYEQDLLVDADAAYILRYMIAPAVSESIIDTSAVFAAKRCRLLQEMDAMQLSSFDDMSLDAVDYIIL